MPGQIETLEAALERANALINEHERDEARREAAWIALIEAKERRREEEQAEYRRLRNQYEFLLARWKARYQPYAYKTANVHGEYTAKGYRPLSDDEVWKLLKEAYTYASL